MTMHGFRLLLIMIMLSLPGMILSAPNAVPATSAQMQATCRYGADHMIALGEQALLEKSSRPERVE